ncbi:MAG: response regulator, partial [Pyrinomonadaceae bacterium]
MRSSHILIADDQPDVLAALRLLLKSEGYKITTAASPTETISLIKSHDFDLLLMDLNYSRDTTSGQEGFDLLERLSELDTNTPIVVMTAWGSVETAVEAMRRGARDFIRKPWDNTRLLTT